MGNGKSSPPNNNRENAPKRLTGCVNIAFNKSILISRGPSCPEQDPAALIPEREEEKPQQDHPHHTREVADIVGSVSFRYVYISCKTQTFSSRVCCHSRWKKNWC
jgi:hypothetical protein